MVDFGRVGLAAGVRVALAGVCLLAGASLAGAAGPPLPSPRPLFDPASPDVPVEDPLNDDFERLVRRYRPDATLLRRPYSRMEMARAVDQVRRDRVVTDPVMSRLLSRLERALAEELAYRAGGRSYGTPLLDPAREVRLEAQAAASRGAADPAPLHGGDAAGPFLALSDRAEAGVGPVVAVAEPRVLADPVGDGHAGLGEPWNLGGALYLDVRSAYARAQFAGIEVTAGTFDRAWGPGRAGIILTNNAEPPATVQVRSAGAFRLPWVFRHAGTFSFESSWSLLSGPRTDVVDPTLWTFQVTWAPIPWFEMGIERAALYGGEGRPPTTATDAARLFFGTTPHTSDDEAQLLFDADEIASVDARLSIPFVDRVPGVQFVEVYWQYAGEDAIERDFLGVRVPSLAGVGNLGGVLVGVGPVTARFEGAILLDDRFRWYEQHRIYHQGFYHRGRVMGHPMRGDARSYRLDVQVDPGGPWSAGAWYEDIERLGVLEEIDRVLYVLPTRERRRRGGFEAAFRLERPGPLRFALRGQVERVTGEGFVAGQDGTYVSVWGELRLPLSRWDLRTPRR